MITCPVAQPEAAKQEYRRHGMTRNRQGPLLPVRADVARTWPVHADAAVDPADTALAWTQRGPIGLDQGCFAARKPWFTRQRESSSYHKPRAPGFPANARNLAKPGAGDHRRQPRALLPTAHQFVSRSAVAV